VREAQFENRTLERMRRQEIEQRRQNRAGKESPGRSRDGGRTTTPKRREWDKGREVTQMNVGEEEASKWIEFKPPLLNFDWRGEHLALSGCVREAGRLSQMLGSAQSDNTSRERHRPSCTRSG